jgi:hypothetical protein
MVDQLQVTAITAIKQQLDEFFKSSQVEVINYRKTRIGLASFL